MRDSAVNRMSENRNQFDIGEGGLDTSGARRIRHILGRHGAPELFVSAFREMLLDVGVNPRVRQAVFGEEWQFLPGGNEDSRVVLQVSEE